MFVNDEFSPRRSEVREDLNTFSWRSYPTGTLSQLRGSILGRDASKPNLTLVVSLPQSKILP